MQTLTKTKVRIDDLTEVMRHVTGEPIPAEVLDRRRRLLSEAEKVRAAMEPIPGDNKDLIRMERGEGFLLWIEDYR